MVALSKRERVLGKAERLPSCVIETSRGMGPCVRRDDTEATFDGVRHPAALTSSANCCQISGRQLPLAAPEVDGNIHTLVSPISSDCSP
jgi:hypothetical protein